MAKAADYPTEDRDLLEKLERNQVLLLQKIEDLTSEEGLFAKCSSTKSTGCSSISKGCSIETLAGMSPQG